MALLKYRLDKFKNLDYYVHMITSSEIFEQVLELPEDQRATLASSILDTLPSPLHEDDEGLAEAHRRSAEMSEDESSIVSWSQIKNNLGR